MVDSRLSRTYGAPYSKANFITHYSSPEDTTMLAALLHGIALAFGLILPLGAQNVFVFNQGASQPQFKKAIPVIITAALCDTLLILLAVLGVSVLVFAIPVLQTALFAVGLVFLLYMGWSIWRSTPTSSSQDAAPLSSKNRSYLRCPFLY